MRVRQVPLAGLADAVRPSTTLVAFSLAQSSDGTAGRCRRRARGGGSARCTDLLRPHPGSRLDALSRRRFRRHDLLGVQVAVQPTRHGLPHGAARGDGAAPADPRRVVRRGVALGRGLRTGDAAGGGRPQVRRVAGLAARGPGRVPAMELFAGLDPELVRAHDARPGRRPAGAARPGTAWPRGRLAPGRRRCAGRGAGPAGRGRGRRAAGGCGSASTSGTTVPTWSWSPTRSAVSQRADSNRTAHWCACRRAKPPGSPRRCGPTA